MNISPNARRVAGGGWPGIGNPSRGGSKAPPPPPPRHGGRPPMPPPRPIGRDGGFGNGNGMFGGRGNHLGSGGGRGYVPGQFGPPGMHGGRPPFNPFQNQGGQQGGQQHGYQGLGEIMQLLQQGVTPEQLQHMTQGATGSDGMAIGGMHGAFSGLSPYAVHFLATSGLLQQAQPQLQDTTGLTGDALFKAQMLNNLAQQQGGQGKYTLHSGIDQSTLAQMLGMTQGGGYAKGYNATGRVNPMTGQPFTG